MQHFISYYPKKYEDSLNFSFNLACIAMCSLNVCSNIHTIYCYIGLQYAMVIFCDPLCAITTAWEC